MSTNNEELISQFKDITGASSAETAQFFLESTNWSLEDAISSFFESDGVNPVMDHESSPEERPGAPLPTEIDENKQTETGENFKNTNKPRFGTLTTMNKADDSSEEEEGQAFYAGGSERSGQQVLGSPKRKNMRAKLTDLFKMAHAEGGAAALSERPSTSTSRTWGVGLRLGQPGDPEDAAVGTASVTRGMRATARSQDSGDIETVVLKLWRQGFSINDGELRLYESPSNSAFLETVMRGEIPEEMQRMGSQIAVDVEDHRQEDFKKPLNRTRTFDGSGHTLGSPVPNIEVAAIPAVATTVATHTSENSKTDNEAKAAELLNLRENEPLTSVQIRLADGSRIARQFNISHTVDDVRQYIINARPQYTNQNFILVTSFPTQELSDGSKTIENAKLQNAVIMQRLK